MLPVITVTLPSYAVMATIGLLVALIFIYFRLDKIGLIFGDFLIYIMAAAVCGFYGARILFVITMIPEIIRDHLLFGYYLLNGGIVFYGGMFGILAGIALVSKIRKQKVSEVYGIMIPAFPLFHSFARIGCLLAGCCYGKAWNWGIVPVDEPAVVRFPVQFFESFCDLVIFVIIMVCEHWYGRKYNLYLYLGSYAICRFILEFFRGDTVRGIWIGGLSTAQIISLLILVWLIWIIFQKRLAMTRAGRRYTGRREIKR